MSKNFLKTVRVLASAAVLATNLVTLPAAAAQPTGVTRTDLQCHDLNVPGREAVQVRVDLAPALRSAATLIRRGDHLRAGRRHGI